MAGRSRHRPCVDRASPIEVPLKAIDKAVVFLEPILHPPVLLQPVLKLEPPELLRLVLRLETPELPLEMLLTMLRLEPPEWLNMLVFLGLVLLELVVLPLVLPIWRSSMSPAQQTDDIVDDVDAQDDEAINIDEDYRTDKRLNWSASAWLHNSKDPVDGIGRKADAYWTDVTKEYNKTIENSQLSVVLSDMWTDLVNKPANS
ncbi:hypothetical protein E2562_009883 [Oryza meyeriana var. granulata]|uniref:Uncharacterized protein n=1 Tax=Oryza meyeriana var. granulata TaxID=110450 RepID=A0A6G1BTY6_9ORYZ|nr:hypothetical protein E2562_009883 [Oryza meyeriana var. granulata]